MECLDRPREESRPEGERAQSPKAEKIQIYVEIRNVGAPVGCAQRVWSVWKESAWNPLVSLFVRARSAVRMDAGRYVEHAKAVKTAQGRACVSPLNVNLSARTRNAGMTNAEESVVPVLRMKCVKSSCVSTPLFVSPPVRTFNVEMMGVAGSAEAVRKTGTA